MRIGTAHDLVGAADPAFPAPVGEVWSRLLAKLDTLADAPAGWEPSHHPLPSADTVARVKAFLQLLRDEGVTPKQVGRSIVGGVGVTIRTDARKVYVEFDNSGSVHALFSDGVAEPRVDKVPADEAGYRAAIAAARAYLYG
jgi:hypothetical protein